MASGKTDPAEEMLFVWRLQDVFSTGRTPEVTYTPRTGGDPTGLTFDDRLKEKAVRGAGGIMLFGVSKSGKTSLVERVLPESQACWLQGTRISSIDDFWRTLGQQLGVTDTYGAQANSDESRTEGDKFEVGFKPVVSAGFDNNIKKSTGETHSWTYSGVVAQQVEDALTAKPRPIVLDDFHHVDPELRMTIAKSIKPLLRKTFIVLVAIPSHSFDPAKTVADIGGRMTQFKLPEWTVDELTAIAQKGFRQLNITDPRGELAKLLANSSFGSPHIMQELCYSLLSRGLNVHETGKTKIAWIPSNFDEIVEDAATEAEPFAFRAILAGRNTKGEGRKDIRLKDGGITDSYGITLLAIKSLVPPIIQRFKAIRQAVSDLTSESIAKERIVAALTGMSAVAEQNKGGADPLFSYRDEVGYIEDPLLAFFLKYGRWREHAVREPGEYTGEPERPLF